MKFILAFLALFASAAFGAPVTAFNGGTGIANNNASTVTLNGAFALALTMTAPTAITLPTSGTLATTAQITGGTLAGSFTTLGVSGLSTLNALTATTITGVGVLDITGTNSTAVLGAEMITNVADRDFSSDSGNWTGTNWTIGAGVDTHTAGVNVLTLNNAALSGAAVIGNFYQIAFTVNTTTIGTLTMAFGGSNGRDVGKIVGTTAQTQGLMATSAAALTLTPDATWAGSIDNISIKLLTKSNAAEIIRNQDLTIGLELRASGSTAIPFNTFVGANAGQSNISGNRNAAFGRDALQFSTTGSDLAAFGSGSLGNNSTGIQNSAFGAGALQRTTTGINNSAFGQAALFMNVTGSGNSGFGVNALFNVSSGSNNLAGGILAGSGITTGSRNVLLGPSTISASLNQVTTGSSNISIGDDVAVSSATASNQLVIGNLIYGTTLSGTGATISTGNIGIGIKAPAQKLDVAGSIRQTGCVTPGTLSANASGDIICTVSSSRFKKNISNETADIADIMALRPVSFEYRPSMKLGARPHFGFIAEQAASVAPQFATYDALGKPYGVDTNALLAATVRALQQQQIMIQALTERVRTLESAANDEVYRRAALR